VTSIGGVKCWGSNAYGQLGDGTKTDSSIPVDVRDLVQGTIAITAGLDNTCALSVVGGVKCWGSNRFGQLGNGTTTDSSLPVAVFGLWRGVRVISGQWAHTCALTAVGAVRCWGLNAYGQLGNGTTTNATIAVNVVGFLRGALGIAAGGGHACAISSAGHVRCWGWNSTAQLGNGSTVNSTVPTDVVGLPDGVDPVFAGGQHTCGLTSNGAVLCWGNNLSGQLGNGTSSGGNGPVGAAGLTGDVIAIAGGGNHTCALSRSGGVTCWGFNRFGELGIGTAEYSAVPVDVVALRSGVAAVTAGQYHTCAVTPTDGGATCWGHNTDGQLGDGTKTDSLAPVKVDLGPI
jgi:alpha-tubulin suppressor-like RCC1 family protein